MQPLNVGAVLPLTLAAGQRHTQSMRGAGERERAAVLLGASLHQRAGSVDEWHLWDNTREAADAAWLLFMEPQWQPLCIQQLGCNGV